jgi:hypothetical protein
MSSIVLFHSVVPNIQRHLVAGLSEMEIRHADVPEFPEQYQMFCTHDSTDTRGIEFGLYNPTKSSARVPRFRTMKHDVMFTSYAQSLRG